jgi:hypothetical protein
MAVPTPTLSKARSDQRRGSPSGGAAFQNAESIEKAAWIAAGLKALAFDEWFLRGEQR